MLRQTAAITREAPNDWLQEKEKRNKGTRPPLDFVFRQRGLRAGKRADTHRQQQACDGERKQMMKDAGQNPQWNRNEQVILQRRAEHECCRGSRRVYFLETGAAEEAVINDGRADF